MFRLLNKLITHTQEMNNMVIKNDLYHYIKNIICPGMQVIDKKKKVY